MVKVLDFGLAKALDPVAGASSADGHRALADAGAAPTQRRHDARHRGLHVSGAGEGRAVDKRADIWAFGVVLYEMLTGRRAFDRGTFVETVASVLESGPDLEALPAATPLVVRRPLVRCLTKAPAERLRHLDGARLDLLDALSPSNVSQPLTGGGPLPAPLVLVGRMGRRCRPCCTVWHSTSGADTNGPVIGSPAARLQIIAPEVRFAETSRSLAVSPDGMRVAYTVDATLHVYDVRTGQTTRLEGLGVTSAWDPFFSPDGQWIGLIEMPARRLRRVPVGGGPAQVIVPSAAPNGASWGDDGHIVFTKSDGALYRVSAEGGEEEVLATPADENTFYAWPDVLPGSRAVLLTVVPHAGTNAGAQLAVLDVETGAVTPLLRGGTNPRYLTSGHIAYVAENMLAVVGFDLEGLSIGGPAIPLGFPVSTTEFGGASFGVSRNGMLAHLPPGPETRRTLVWVDRDGGEEPVAGLSPGHYWVPSVSPDGRQVALDMFGPRRNVSLWDIERELMTPLTRAPLRGSLPVWHPNGRQVFVRGSHGSGPSNVYAVNADGTGSPQLVEAGATELLPSFLTPEGDRLLVQQSGTGMLATVSLPSSGALTSIPDIPALASWPATLSPNGRWIAYGAGDPQPQVIVRPFPNVEAGRTVVASGRHPLWAPDGSELYYRGESGNVMVVPVPAGAQFEAARPRELFPNSGFAPSLGARDYDVSPRDGRFLMIKQDEREARRDRRRAELARRTAAPRAGTLNEAGHRLSASTALHSKTWLRVDGRGADLAPAGSRGAISSQALQPDLSDGTRPHWTWRERMHGVATATLGSVAPDRSV
jgi:WD40 repeat protein